jgi:ERCC4-related helicase
MKGKLIMLVTKGTRDETFYYVSMAKEKSMHSAMSSIKDELFNKQEKQQTLIE